MLASHSAFVSCAARSRALRSRRSAGTGASAPMPDLMRLLRSIEAAGFDGAGILDSQMLSRDTFVVLGQAATNTSRLTLFPAVTNPFTRHPSVLAGAIQTVEEMAPGRVKFVIGTGYTSASTIGRKPATLAEMRACIGIVRGLLAGESVDFAGMSGRLGYAAKRRIPIVMAASGPKAIELAGEIAKLGVRNLYLMPLLTFGLPEPEIAAFRDVVFPRLREAGLRGAR